MPRYTRTWSESELDELVDLYSKGWGLNKLSRHFHSDSRSIQKHLIERGQTLRPMRQVTFTPEVMDDIVRLYTVEQHEASVIARAHNTTPYLVKRVLKERGVPLRPLSHLTEADHNEIERLYTEDKLSVLQLSHRFDRSLDTIKRTLISRGITDLRGCPQKTFTDCQRADIVGRYSRGEGLTHIAATYHCSFHPIRRVLRESGVEIRDWRGVMKTRRENDGFLCLPKSVFQSRRSGAKNRGTPWTITIKDLNAQYELQKGLCYYTGAQMKTASRDIDYSRELANNPLTLSVDRRDSNGGYTPDNIVLCCRFANYAKNQYPEEQFKAILRTIAGNLSGRNLDEQVSLTEDSLTP